MATPKWKNIGRCSVISVLIKTKTVKAVKNEISASAVSDFNFIYILEDRDTFLIYLLVGICRTIQCRDLNQSSFKVATQCNGSAGEVIARTK